MRGKRSSIALVVVSMLAVIAPPPVRADLKVVMAEPNLEKRSKLAMENAFRALREAREAYQKGDIEHVGPLIAETQESVQLAEASLQQTGKNPRRSPKWFKRAEMETRDMVRRIENFRQEMSFDDRPMLDNLHTSVQKVHDDLLTGLMEGKRRK